MTKNILVFGGNRFLGIHLLDELTKQFPQAQIISVTRSGGSTGSNVQSHTCDRKDSSKLKEIVAEKYFDYVFDLSAYQAEDLKASLQLLNDNVGIWAFMSSAGIYAKTNNFPIQTHFSKINVLPHLGKLQCEELLNNTPNLHSFYLRPFYIYGPHNTFDRETFFFKAIEAGQTILIPGDGSTLLQFAHVRDVAKIMIALALQSKDKTNSKAFHPVEKQAYTINALIAACEEVVGKKAQIKYFTTEECIKAGVASRDVFPLRAEHYFGDYTNIANLGIEAETKLAEGLKETYKWFKENRSAFPANAISEAGQKILNLGS